MQLPISSAKKIVPGTVNTSTFDHYFLDVNRVTNVTSMGRIFSFSTFVVVGNYNGYFGYGKSKSNEVMTAKKVAKTKAVKNLFFIPLREKRTIHHSTFGKCGSVKVFLKPARVGTGVVASGTIKILLEMIGIKDCVVKCHGSPNKRAQIIATIKALLKISNVKLISSLRNKNIREVINKKTEKTDN